MIPLIAKALLPAAIIFIPIYVGLKIFRYYKNDNKYKDEVDIEPYNDFV